MTVRVSTILTNDTLNRAITIESNGDPNAKASSSTATGLGQYLNQSWLGALYEWGPLPIARRIRKNGKKWIVPDGGERAILDMRKAAGKPELLKLNIDILARDWENHTRILGKGWNDGDLYLCHFLGPGAAKKLLRADPNATAVSVAGQGAADANPTIFYVIQNRVRVRAKTCAELRAWALNAMKTRWDKTKPHARMDWIAKYYPEQAHAEPEPDEIDAAERDERPPMKVDVNERDDDETGEDRSIDPVPAPVPLPRPRPTTTKPAPKGFTIKGDPEIWWIQYRLQRMHYGPALLDGAYGGKTAGAITGFINDRKEPITPPNSNESFAAIQDELVAALDRAEADSFVRPVTQERKEAAPEIVDEVAPEAKPVKRNFIMGLLASLGASIASVFNGLKESVGDAWSFFFDHKDDIPDEVTEHATSFLGMVPGWVWLLGAAAIFLAFALNSGSGLKQIVDKVKTGER